MHPIQELLSALAPLGNPSEQKRRSILREVVFPNLYSGALWAQYLEKPRRLRYPIHSEDSAETIIKQALEGVRLIGLRKWLRAHPAQKTELKTPPARFLSEEQKPFIQAFLARPRLMMGHEMGKGKTISAIVALSELYGGIEQIKGTVICTTKSTIPNWISEITRFGLTSETIEDAFQLAEIRKRIKAVKAGKSGALRGSSNKCGLFGGGLQNSGAGLESNIILCTHAAFEEGRRLANAMEIAGNPMQSLIIDEAHLCANPDTLRGKNLLSCAKTAKNILMLTGTPLNKISIQELDFYFGMIYPDMLSRNFLQEAFIGKKDKEKAFKNAELLSRLIRHIMPGRLIWDEASKKEFLDARLEIKMIDFAPSKETRDVIAHIEASEAHPFQKKAQVNRAVEADKIQAAIRRIDAQLAGGKKAVVFSALNAPLEALKTYYGESAVLLTGQTQNRGGLIGRFISDAKVRVFLGNIVAAGTGINLQNTDKVIIIDGGYRRQDIQQAVARVYRRGNMHHVITAEYITSESIPQERRKLEIVDKKTTAVSLIIDGAAASITGAENKSGIITKEEQDQKENEKRTKKAAHEAFSLVKADGMRTRARMDSRQRFVQSSRDIVTAFLKAHL